MSAAAQRVTIKNVRTARGAAERRRTRTASLRYRSLVEILSALGVATVVVVVYLGLMANETRLSYENGKLVRERTRLVEAVARLDDQVARMESRERLAALAAGLGMRDSERFDVAILPPPPAAVTAQPPSGIALIPTLASWFR